MSDLISRKAEIDGRIGIQRTNGMEVYDDEAVPVEYLKRLPSAQPEPKWIPCSERLPEVEELVLVTDDSGGIKTVDIDRCGQYENSDERFWYYTQNAVAWMPMPEPYQAEIEE